MALRKIRVTLPDGKAVDVPIADSNDQWEDITAEDGTKVKVKVRVKTGVSAVARVDGQPLEMSPLYTQKSSPVVAIVRLIFSFLFLLLGRPKAEQPVPGPTFKS